MDPGIGAKFFLYGYFHPLLVIRNHNNNFFIVCLANIITQLWIYFGMLSPTARNNLLCALCSSQRVLRHFYYYYYFFGLVKTTFLKDPFARHQRIDDLFE